MKYLNEGNIPQLKSKINSKVEQADFDAAVGDIEAALEAILGGSGGGLDPETLRKIYEKLSTDGYFAPEEESDWTEGNILPTLNDEFAPSNTLAGLKAALNRGNASERYAIGQEIPDTYAGNDNPLIVGTFQTLTQNGQSVRACGLVRKYAEPTSQTFGSSLDYGSSAIFQFLQNTYFNNCSEEAKKYISNVTVKCNGADVTGKWHLLGGPEVGATYGSGDGVFWEYWKQKTSLASANNAANAGRIVESRGGSAQSWWLRSRFSSSGVAFVRTDGAASGNGPSASFAVVPVCWILQDVQTLQMTSLPTRLLGIISS